MPGDFGHHVPGASQGEAPRSVGEYGADQWLRIDYRTAQFVKWIFSEMILLPAVPDYNKQLAKEVLIQLEGVGYDDELASLFLMGDEAVESTAEEEDEIEEEEEEEESEEEEPEPEPTPAPRSKSKKRRKKRPR